MEQTYIAVNAELLKECLSAFEKETNGQMVSVGELISKLTKVLKDEDGKSVDNAKLLLESKGYFHPGNWHLDDIKLNAQSSGYFLSDEQVKEVASIIRHNHDASIDYNWENFDYHVGEYVEEFNIPECEFIEFDGDKYPAREIEITHADSSKAIVKVSVMSLNNAITKNICSTETDEATEIDDSIFYYVQDDQINVPESELALIVQTAIS